MIEAAAIVVLIASVTLIGIAYRQMGVLLRTFEVPQARDTPEAYDDSKLWGAINDLTTAVAHGIAHVDRNEKRVRGIVIGASGLMSACSAFDR